MKIMQFVGTSGLTRHQFRADFVAALVVTAVAIPESLGFAAIVGLPIETGLYCALLAPVDIRNRHLIETSHRRCRLCDSCSGSLRGCGCRGGWHS